MSSVKTIEWCGDHVRMIDQRKLPASEEYVVCRTHEDVARSISDMVIRGAPAIGVAAAMGVALWAASTDEADEERFFAELERVGRELCATRPTAVNLFWAVERMKSRAHAERGKGVEAVREVLVAEARLVCEEDVRVCRRLGANGAALIADGATVMTHCNAGALATAGYGTALGVVRAAVEEGKRVRVIACETRPFLQGARLTAWELHRDGIPVTLITDNMAGWVMKRGMVDAVMVGADRIAANGDVANKIGTYSLALLARHHGVPFYVAAPLSTVDFSCPDGGHIPIEERDPVEVTHVAGVRVAPPVEVFNPAFDVTPNERVDAIVTERGVVRKPYAEGLERLRRADF